jgi:hypothetical protein
MHLRASLIALLALAAACSGGQSTSIPPTAPQADRVPGVSPEGATVFAATPTPMPSTIVLKSGAVIGADNRFTPNDGDASSGGNGQTVDGIPCASSMVENKYHVHAFVGILVNKLQIGVPDAVGLYQYGPDVNGYTNAAKCFYYIHTHDATGMIHIESPSTASLGSSIFTLKNLLDVWGMGLSSSAFGPFAGTVHVFVATTPLRNIYSGTYAAFTGDPHTIKLYSHEAIWIEVGSSYFTASQLPKIRFYTEY